jgi:hypothetical protein
LAGYKEGLLFSGIGGGRRFIAIGSILVVHTILIGLWVGIISPFLRLSCP